MKYINLLFFLVMVIMNYLANAIPINGNTTGSLSAQYPNLFVPAGVTFSIWGVIYLLLAVFVIVQLRAQNQVLTEAVGWAFAVSCILNSLWILAWHYEKLPLSMIIMAGLLISLVYINIRLTALPFGITRAAFGIYLGWICIATIANATALLVNYNWGGWGISDQAWAIIMIAAGLVITAITLYKVNNPFLGLAVIWAFIGIYINRQDDYQGIAVSAIVAAVIMAVFTIYSLYSALQKPGPV